MPPWRIKHESHTCSEQSLRILMWNASYVQKNTPITPDRNGSVKRLEKNWKGTIAMSSARWNKLTDCEDRANRKIWKQVIWKRHGGSWVGHIPCPKMKQVRDKGIPSSYHHGKAVSSLLYDCQTMNPPPAVWLEVLLISPQNQDRLRLIQHWWWKFQMLNIYPYNKIFNYMENRCDIEVSRIYVNVLFT